MDLFNILYELYFCKFQSKTFDRLFTRILIRVSNIFIPFYFTLTNGFSSNSLSSKKTQNRPLLIVSLTTFPDRIEKVWLTIESILRQDTKPDRIVLWLYEGEFINKDLLPSKLLALEKRGLEIRFCNENLMPHKKYYYTILENPDADIITIDDDMIYPSNLICKLLVYHKSYPNVICCPITREINIIDGIIQPYKSWKYLRNNSEPSFFNLVMGGGGAFFPSKSLSAKVLDKEQLIELALKADDLWLKVMSLISNTKVLSLAGEYPRFFIPILSKNTIRLSDSNIGELQNDKIFKKLIERFQINVANFHER